MKFKKKAQAEMIGLVIIVIMLTMGMLFMARFALKDDAEKKIYTRKGLAYSAMSAILKTTTFCQDQNGGNTKRILSIGKELIDDCAKSYGSSYSQFRCSGTHVCEFTSMRITSLLNDTLGKWNKNYDFSSSLIQGTEKVELISVTNGGCQGAKERDSSGLFPLYVTGVGLVENTLYLCD